MQRITTDQRSQPTVYRQQPPASVSPPAAEVPGHEQPALLPSGPQLRQPVNLSPRTVAPEKLGGLAAMRELAKASANSAISRHVRRQLSLSARSKLAVAGVGAVTGAILIWLWSTKGAPLVTFHAGLVGLIVAIFWGIQYAVATGRLIFSKSGNLEFDSRRGKSKSPKAGNKAGEPDMAEAPGDNPRKAADVTPAEVQ